MRILDVDHDNHPEVIVSFSSAKAIQAQWVLRWDGTTLASIGPEEVDEDADAYTVLADALFTDLDGDGTLEIVNAPEDFDPRLGPQPVEYEVYALTNGHYGLSKTLVFFGTFARPPKPATSTTGRQNQNAQPEVVTRTFLVDVPGSAYEMTIINGDELAVS